MAICSMKNPSIYFWILLLFAGLVSCSTAKERWIRIDNFESPNTMQDWIQADTKNETIPYVDNPQVTEIRDEASGNHYLLKKPAKDDVVGNRKALTYRPLPVEIPVGEVYTVYARINVEYFPNNHVFGLSNLDVTGINENDYNALEPSLRVTDKYESNGYKNDGTLMVRKGQDYEKVWNASAGRSAHPLKTDTWYEVWFVVNNRSVAEGGQTYDVYVRGGAEFPEQQSVYMGADFRMKRELPLTYFLMNCNTGPADKPYGNGGLRYDDLFMIQGEVFSTP